MPRTRRTIPLEEKIAAAQEKVEKTKKNYENAVKELKELENKKEEQKRKNLIETIVNSDKSVEEIMNFLNS